MEETNKKYVFIAALVGLFTLLAIPLWKLQQRDEQIRELQNALAARDQTVEVQKDVYAKLALQVDNLKTVIDKSTAEGKRLADEVAKSKAELVSVNTTLISLKKQVADGAAHQEPVPDPAGATTAGPGRTKVSFGKDFGFARVDGYTITSPPEYHLELGQGSKPLQLTLALTQLPDKSWKTLVASSDTNVGVDVRVSAVNPLALEYKWWQRIQLRLDAGFGPGILGGFSATYEHKALQFGPSVWGVITSDRGAVFYGGSIGWFPGR